MTLAELRKALRDAEQREGALTRAIERFEKVAKFLRSIGLKALGASIDRKAKQSRRDRDNVRDRIRILKDKIEAATSGVPSWVPPQHADKWRAPWTVDLAGDADFKALLWSHGYASPNFSRLEAGGTERHPLGCPVPETLRSSAQYHAFALERVRHELGDPSMTPLSWYRCPPHNSAVGGASASQHMKANATDWPDGERARLGGERFDQAMERQFANGGRGYQGYVGGPIRHVDNGSARTWVYA